MKLLRYISIIAPALLTLTSCSDELSGTDWEPGEPSNAAGVYFSPDNDKLITILAGKGFDAEIKVQRIDCKGQLTVPVVVKASDAGMVVPESITFADGSYDASLIIDCSGVPSTTELPLQLTFPDEYLNPYAAGAPEYSGAVILSSWENVSPTGLTDFEILSWNLKSQGIIPFKGELLHLAGSNRYKAMNFLDTGIDFTFELNPSPLKSTYYRIVPLGNQLLLSDYGWGDYSYYNSWWLITDDFDSEDEEAEGWPDLNLEYENGKVTTVYYPQFLWYDEASKTEYCYVANYDKGKPIAYMAFYGNLDEDMETYASYMQLRFAWTFDVEQ